MLWAVIFTSVFLAVSKIMNTTPVLDKKPGLEEIKSAKVVFSKPPEDEKSDVYSELPTPKSNAEL